LATVIRYSRQCRYRGQAGVASGLNPFIVADENRPGQDSEKQNFYRSSLRRIVDCIRISVTLVEPINRGVDKPAAAGSQVGG